MGPDGVRVNARGQRLEFEILDANPAFERWTLPFVQNLKRIGVSAVFRPVDDAQYTRRIQNFDFDITSSVIGQSDSPGNEQLEFWTSSRADTVGSRNLIGIKNPVIDELVAKIITSRTREDLVAHVRALDRVLQWNYYVIPQWYFGAWRMAWWTKLDHPAHLSGMTPAIVDTWWAKKK
jgi:microcin C transport system substrate-binding protein